MENINIRRNIESENIVNLNKDRGEVLVDVRKDVKNFSFIIGKNFRKTLDGGIQNVNSFRKIDEKKYNKFFDLAESFPGIWRKHEMKEVEKLINKKFAGNVDKLIILNQLIELNKFSISSELWKIIEKHIGEGKLPLIGAMDSILKNTMKEDYRIIDRGLKIYGWDDIASMMEHKNDIKYEMIVDDKKFLQVEKSVGKIEKEYGRKLKFEDAKTNLVLLSKPEYAEKILSLKEQINELEEFYKINKIEHIDAFEKIDGLRETGELKEILSGGFKFKMDKLKEVYNLHKFGSIDILQNWKDLPEEEFEKISSKEFAKKIEGLGEKIGRSKTEIINFFAGENFKNIDHPTVEALLEEKVILSSDVKQEKPDIFEILGNFPKIYAQEPSLWGRIRQSEIRNGVDLATFGRPGLGRDPYIGWEYLAAARNITKDDLKKQVNYDKLLLLAEGDGEEPGLEKAKERLSYVRENLPSPLKARFNKVFENLEEGRKEGVEIEEKNSKIFLNAGAYVDTSIDLETIKSFNRTRINEKGYYREIYNNLDKSFKSPSWTSLRIGDGIEMLYELINKRKEDFKRELRNIEYLMKHQQNLSPEEIKILEGKSTDILNAFGILESLYNMPKGVYFSNPPLHGGLRGEESLKWMARTAALRDRAFQEIEENGKVSYVNTKEYYLSKQVKPLDQLKIQLISFSDKPDPKSLANEGFSVKLERNGQTKFLDKKEMEEFTKALKEYTLPTLFLKKSPLLEVGEKKEIHS